MKTKAIIITAVCEATVTERWVYTVPDDTPTPNIHYGPEALDRLADVCTDLRVENTDVDNEHDRRLVDVSVSEPDVQLQTALDVVKDREAARRSRRWNQP